MLQAVHRLQHRLQTRPKVGPRKRRQRDQDLGPDGGKQRRHGRRFQKRIEGGDDAGRLSAPDGEMGFGEIGEEEGDHVVLADAERVEGIGRLGDPTNSSR